MVVLSREHCFSIERYGVSPFSFVENTSDDESLFCLFYNLIFLLQYAIYNFLLIRVPVQAKHVPSSHACGLSKKKKRRIGILYKLVIYISSMQYITVPFQAK